MRLFLSKITFAALISLIAFAGCSDRSSGKLIKDAERQLRSLVKESEEGKTLRIPSSFKDGKVQFVPVDD